MNWLYHHLRRVPRYRPVVMANALQNRVQYPETEAFATPWQRLGSRAWRRLAGSRPYPPDVSRARGYHPVLLHSHFGYTGIDDLPLQRALGVPWLVGFYGADVYLHGRDRAWLDRYGPLWERVDLALALGPAMEAALVEMGCPSDKIVVHPLGVDVEDVPHGERRLAPGDRLDILMAGTFREKKGAVYLLQAADLLRRRGVRFRLHLAGDVSRRQGDAEARDEILATIARLDFGDQLQRYSWLEFRDLMALALRCHVFVAPSVVARDGDAEGTPFVIQQMMLSGMPVISTRHSDIPYVYGPLADRLAPERDATALADQLTRYVDEPETIAADGAAMRARMLEAFDIRQCSAHLASLYDRVVR
ncbi:MAG: glycosyltransferase [Gemmatimonadales bacterium]